MTIAGLFSVLTFQVRNLQLRFVIGLYKIEHIIRRGNHLYGNPVNRDFACLLCPFLARIRLPALQLPAMAQQVANRMLEDHLRVVSRTPAHRE